MPFSYTVQFSRRKSIALALTRQGKFVVRAPARVDRNFLRDFVSRKQDWMVTTWQRFLELKASRKKFVAGESFLYLGEQFPLRLVPGRQTALRFVDGRSFYLTSSADQMGEAAARELFTRWYRRQAQSLFSDRVEYYARVLGVQPPRVTITSAETRWGSCSSRGTVNFSFRVIMAPRHVVDYVIVHELVHLVHFNHSKKFWQLVANICVDWKQARTWLQKHGHTLVV